MTVKPVTVAFIAFALEDIKTTSARCGMKRLDVRETLRRRDDALKGAFTGIKMFLRLKLQTIENFEVLMCLSQMPLEVTRIRI